MDLLEKKKTTKKTATKKTTTLQNTTTTTESPVKAFLEKPPSQLKDFFCFPTTKIVKRRKAVITLIGFFARVTSITHIKPTI